MADHAKRERRALVRILAQRFVAPVSVGIAKVRRVEINLMQWLQLRANTVRALRGILSIKILPIAV
jgi:hypothetical protein